MKNLLFLFICTLIYMTLSLNSCSKSEPPILKEKGYSGVNLESSPPVNKGTNQSSSQSFQSDYTSSSSYSNVWEPSSSNPSSFKEVEDSISEVPLNPNRTIGSLIENSDCNLVKCEGPHCYAYCDDISKFEKNLNCRPPLEGNSSHEIYGSLNCSSNPNYNVMIGINHIDTSNITEDKNIEKELYYRTCTDSIRYCAPINTAIANKKPKNFRVLIAYPGGCISSGDNNTGLPFTIFNCTNDTRSQTTSILLEKIECTNWMYYNCYSVGNPYSVKYTLGFKQNDSFISIDDDIGPVFAMLDCKNQRASYSCHLK